MNVARVHVVSDDLEDAVESILQAVGEDACREGLRETPRRVAAALRFLTEGYRISPEDVIGSAQFAESYDEMVVVRDIPFYSLCEHHMLPFFGRCHIAYLPTGRVVGLSKLPRLVDVFAHRLQLQERLTRDIAGAIDEQLDPSGVGVVVEANHMCMEMRGVKKTGSQTVTSCMLGAFRDDARTRAEFMQLVRHA